MERLHGTKTCRFVILPQQEHSSENPPPSKREFVRKGSPEVERARLGLESVQKHSVAEASVHPKGCCAAELSRYHENAPYAHTTLQTEGIMESLTKSSKVAIEIAGMLALACVAALIFVLAREASILTENEHDKPVHELTISDNFLPAYRPYSVSSSSVVFESDIDISRIYAMSISNYPPPTRPKPVSLYARSRRHRESRPPPRRHTIYALGRLRRLHRIPESARKRTSLVLRRRAR